MTNCWLTAFPGLFYLILQCYSTRTVVTCTSMCDIGCQVCNTHWTYTVKYFYDNVYIIHYGYTCMWFPKKWLVSLLGARISKVVWKTVRIFLRYAVCRMCKKCCSSPCLYGIKMPIHIYLYPMSQHGICSTKLNILYFFHTHLK